MSQVEPHNLEQPPVNTHTDVKSIPPVEKNIKDKAPTSEISQEYVKAEEFRKIIEVEVLKIIKDLADKGETTRERIQEIASSTLGLVHPDMSLEELFSGSVHLDDAFPELAPVVVKIMQIYETQFEMKALDQVSALVKNGQFEKANDMVKKVLLFKVT